MTMIETKTRPAPPSNRTKLKDATHALHKRLDDSVAAHDIASTHGYGLYLMMNASALHVLSKSPPHHMQAQPSINTMRDGAFADCETLGLSVPTDTRVAPKLGLGALYVVAGSRIGARYLHRDILKRGDKKLQSAMRFFKPQPVDRIWPDLLRELETLDAFGLARVTGDAEDTFDLFMHAFQAAESA
jgi:heme oxygenase